jgi:hypothetical protein
VFRLTSFTRLATLVNPDLGYRRILTSLSESEIAWYRRNCPLPVKLDFRHRSWPIVASLPLQLARSDRVPFLGAEFGFGCGGVLAG